MPFDIKIINPRRSPNVIPHRVAPVRFARAVTGFTEAGAPDLDDRGFTIPAQFGLAHGPVVGMAQGVTIRVKVKRDRLESTSQIFPTIDNAAAASIVFPPVGSPLNPFDTPGRQADCVFLQGTATGTADQETKLKIHFGSPSGPVLAETAIRVYPLLTIRVQAHLVEINGVGPDISFATIQSLFADINAIYEQAGVTTALQPTASPETVTLKQAGTLELDNDREENTVLRLNPNTAMLNAYFVHHFSEKGTLGFGISRDTASGRPANPATGDPGGQVGLVVRDADDTRSTAGVLAHEIGHVLNLRHYSLGERGTPPDVRHDIWGHRNLMHNFLRLLDFTRPPGNRFRTSAPRNQVGYGTITIPEGTFKVAGHWLGTKSRPGIQQSDQINVLRQATAAGTFLPI